jgi:hypothetical protein
MRALCAALASAAMLMQLQGTAAAGKLEHDFYARTWGVEGTPEQIASEQACLGHFQSPVNLKPDFSSLPQLPAELFTHFSFPKVKHPYIKNAGHVIEVRMMNSYLLPS